MNDAAYRKKLFSEAFGLLARAQALLLAARAKHEQKAVDMEHKKAA